MSRQEEIREGMREFILEVRQYLCSTEFAPEPFSKSVDIEVLREMGNAQLKKMGSQGAVIKVDRELPERMFLGGYGYIQGHQLQVLLDKVGCVAIEPLIKEE